MSEEPKTADYEARRAADSAAAAAQRALDRIAIHERHCEERARRADAFEADMRAELKSMTDGFEGAFRRIHSRLDDITKGTVTLQRSIILGGASVLLGGIGGVLWWMLTHPGEGVL